MSEQRSSSLPFGLPAPSVRPRDLFDATLRMDPEAVRKVEVGIPMRDGVELAANVFLPPGTPRPVPAIVLGTPYDKDWAPPEEIERRAAAGYASVYFDVRGRGKSEGDWQPRVLRDGVDGHDVVEWVAAQDWCDGNVGIEGLSYGGWIVWTTIKERPEHLRAAIPTSPSGRFMEELPYTYGCFWLYYAWWFAIVRRRINDSSIDVSQLLKMLPVEAMGEVLNLKTPGWEEMLEHDTLDELWRGRRWDGEYDFDLPVLHVTGWFDREDIWGAFHHYENMIATSPAREQQWLLVGPWSHASALYPSDEYKGVTSPGGSIDMAAIHLRFFDRFLKGERNGVDEEPRVRLYDTGAGAWEVRERWQGGTEEFEAFLADRAGLSAAPGAEGSDTYSYDPRQPNGWKFDVEALPWEPPLDLTELESQAGVAVWTGEALAGDLTVRGWGEVELWAETDREDTEWHVKLADVDPAGRSLCVAWGCLRASYGDDPIHPAGVNPGEVRRYKVELTPAFHTFRAGHRLRLVLASSEYPWYARNLNRFEPIAKQAEPLVATNTIHHGAGHPSCLRLRVEAGRSGLRARP